MIYMFLAEGFEEVEALTPLDFIRRCEELEIKTVTVDKKFVTGSHGITVLADVSINDVNLSEIEMIILPGGMPGTLNLERSKQLQDIIDYCVEKDIYIASICAAPSILGHKGLLEGKNATCYTGFDTQLIGANYVDEEVVVDGKFITAQGAGVASQFAFKIIEILEGAQRARKLKAAILWR